jgi:hypothetical protein
MDHGHAAEQRASIQFTLSDLRHGLVKGGEFHQEAIHKGNELPDLVVREVCRDGNRRGIFPVRR